MRALGAVLALILTTWLGAPAPAAAQNPYAAAIKVNDGVITNYDIAQRTLLLEALGARGDVRAVAVQQLTEDRLKVQAAKALGIELPEGAIFTGIEEFATQRGLTVDQVYEVLAARQIDQQTMNDFVEAGLMWREVVGSRFRQRAMPTDQDIDLALEIGSTVETYQLAEIALPFAERGEEATYALADQLYRELSRGGDFAAAARRYSRASSAPQGGTLDAVVAQQLPPPIRAQILLLSPGGVTEPLPISGGVALLKLVAIRDTPREQAFRNITPEELRNQVREEIFTQRMTSFGQGYLQELLRDALIVEP